MAKHAVQALLPGKLSQVASSQGEGLRGRGPIQDALAAAHELLQQRGALPGAKPVREGPEMLRCAGRPLFGYHPEIRHVWAR